MKSTTTESETRTRATYSWMPLVSAIILIFGFLPPVGQFGTGDVIIDAIQFGVGIYLAYLSNDEQRNPGWHLLSLGLLVCYSILFLLVVFLSDWSSIVSFWVPQY